MEIDYIIHYTNVTNKVDGYVGGSTFPGIYEALCDTSDFSDALTDMQGFTILIRNYQLKNSVIEETFATTHYVTPERKKYEDRLNKKDPNMVEQVVCKDKADLIAKFCDVAEVLHNRKFAQKLYNQYSKYLQAYKQAQGQSESEK
ncbi:MAG: hypothetical protein K6F08_00790 [bacterium]|nr:hypothetical protein [bacterium]